MKRIDFKKYENANSSFTAELSPFGEYVTFSNSGKRGDVKYFTLSLNSLLTSLTDILNNLAEFDNNSKYNEANWRDLGSKFFKDPTANAMCTVQTKPMFVTLSKLVMWANSLSYNDNNPESNIILSKIAIETAVNKLTALVENLPLTIRLDFDAEQKSKIIVERKIRNIAKLVLKYFHAVYWNEVLKKSTKKTSSMNDEEYESYTYNIFTSLIAGFDTEQPKETLTRSNLLCYFENPIFIDNGKHYYFTTQWNASGNHNLSFNNLKKHFESEFPGYLLENINNNFFLYLKTNKVQSINFNLGAVIDSVSHSNLIYSPELIHRFVASLLTKPFVILTGLSGSGKTKLAQAFAQWISEDASQYRIIPVGADWTNREPLLGYPNALNSEEYVLPENGALELIIDASKPENSQKPYFLILDEMKLSHVERYFADFLSTMESKDAIPLHSSVEPLKAANDQDITIPNEINLPENLFIIGTVNIDETTHMFSPKVLDRANTIEFRISTEEMRKYFKDIKPLNMEKLIAQGAGMGANFVELAQKPATLEIKDNATVIKKLNEFFVELS